MSSEGPRHPSPSASDASIPIAAARYAWPLAGIDPVMRMRALAAGLPHVAADETVLDHPFERVWPFLTDFEVATPLYEGIVGRARIIERHESGGRLTLETQSPLLGPWTRFDVVLQPGFCLMQSRIGQVGMAARPEGPTATRFFHFEGSPVLGRILRPFFAWNIRQDFRRLRELL
jgi:hypothetical protein